MSFDPRSLERLRELGRQLPARLPEPEKPSAEPKASQVRHRVETEKNPEELFRELMKASQDGTVPEHLMARLKQLEAQRKPSGQVVPFNSDTDVPGLAAPAHSRPGPGKNTQPKRPKVDPGSEEESLYVAFGQLLLEDDGDDV
ncbi:hypothetical protein KR52_10720 [Synechococcus sp. KORDI-52]|uniref:hypothetical protein n=1 Tax=Synechococcus sp. KORDI-52 TaxID=585425 RepID=UPI0004E097F9|nr:hypothetical protein [Synechococcus sp. KORDI-52]AII49613.1 hypothetical protein KR52_10720 [Synechococcus sp. KORDI-52]